MRGLQENEKDEEAEEEKWGYRRITYS